MSLQLCNPPKSITCANPRLTIGLLESRPYATHRNTWFYVFIHSFMFFILYSLRSVREFTTKILESEQRIHILINNSSVMWMPLRRTVEGHEYHWGHNHLAHFAMTQLMMPLLLR